MGSAKHYSGDNSNSMNVSELVHQRDYQPSKKWCHDELDVFWVNRQCYQSPPNHIPKKEKRKRENVPLPQKVYLERVFKDTQYPDAKLREELAELFHTTSRRIQIWFQNRRMKQKA
ncbi:hypothetical protein PROFUN_04498 [Planoprotostelium fungivorum]|uniref:Homeobox domain-containing protein n=1 Tax=Planoprotostelium fungivorum TaxID=1890364 RepID=A0A2P6NBE9_9EUKA|nr:hypothetical protein PROFUN_04498 [Planoprotostelium fungivorum]